MNSRTNQPSGKSSINNAINSIPRSQVCTTFTAIEEMIWSRLGLPGSATVNEGQQGRSRARRVNERPSRVFSGRSNDDLDCDQETDISKMTSYGFEGWLVAVRRGRICDQSTELCQQRWDHVSKEERRWKD
jgi:hypothetical protein